MKCEKKIKMRWSACRFVKCVITPTLLGRRGEMPSYVFTARHALVCNGSGHTKNGLRERAREANPVAGNGMYES
jgi:hypothetical protein